ncbi:class I SAM-dependent methyltransferase [Thermosynechococcaceae cyanobacterium Okahandja]
MSDLTAQESHFSFGKNWAAYAEKVTEGEITEAERGLQKLLGQQLDGLRFLDIGCGSGLHALAALRLGAREVIAVDIDADSVATTCLLLERWLPNAAFRVECQSVFDLNPEVMGKFDVVYSWGVLHHTGDMLRALRQASELVMEGGRFACALYRRTWMDWFWRSEKSWYAQASISAQTRARAIYQLGFRLALAANGRSYSEYVANYRTRGMHFEHDVHDWLGGWPYETISPGEVEAQMRAIGFVPEQIFATRGRFGGRHLGLFGSGCDEYVYRRV